MSLDWDIVLFAFGAFLLVMVMVIVVLERDFTHSQQHTFQIVLALASALIATAIPGLFIEIGSELVGLALRASGAIAVFIFVYRFTPATTYSKETKISESNRGFQKQPNGGVWKKYLGCLLLAIILVICVLAVFGTIYLKPAPVIALWNGVFGISNSRQLTINKTGYSSNVDGFTITLTNIEFLEDNKKMCTSQQHAAVA